MGYQGAYAPGSTVYGMFNTKGLTSGAPITLAGTPTLRCYKNASDTEDDSGITLTVDFDSITGLHHWAIDTSTDGTFYAAGSEIFVKINAGTVDSVSVVGTIVGQFSLVTDGLTIAQETDVTTATAAALGAAGIDTDGVTRIAGVDIEEGGTAPGSPIGEA